MTDETAMRQIGDGDQINAELRDTAGRTAAYFRILVANGVPEDAAAAMAGSYNDLMLDRHFGVQTVQIDLGALE